MRAPYLKTNQVPEKYGDNLYKKRLFALFLHFFFKKFGHFKKKQYLCTRFWKEAYRLNNAQ